MREYPAQPRALAGLLYATSWSGDGLCAFVCAHVMGCRTALWFTSVPSETDICAYPVRFNCEIL